MTARALGPHEPHFLADSAIPACLRDLSHRLEGLWCLGDLALLDRAPEGLVAIVGTRDCSIYGERIARRLATAAAKAGLVVVSGMARGIDAAAHRAALAAGGKTIAVLGTGVDVPYPASHRTLHGLVQENGLVISEMEPGTRAFRGCFPRRNRVIARISKVVVVVEAGFQSGAVNTANQAMEMGIPVAAVPGQADDPRAAGSNRLIRDGGHILTDVEDLLTLMGISTGRRGGAGGTLSGGIASERARLEHAHVGSAGLSSGAPDVGAAGLPAAALGAAATPADRAMLSMLGHQASTLDDLATTAGLSVRQISESLIRLELEGLVAQEGGCYRRVG